MPCPAKADCFYMTSLHSQTARAILGEQSRLWKLLCQTPHMQITSGTSMLSTTSAQTQLVGAVRRKILNSSYWHTDNIDNSQCHYPAEKKMGLGLQTALSGVTCSDFRKKIAASYTKKRQTIENEVFLSFLFSQGNNIGWKESFSFIL